MKIELIRDKIYSREKIVEQLIDGEYDRVSIVVDRGEFAVRGGIIDIFPLNQTDPVRLEFFGNLLESLRCFTISDQRSSRPLASTMISDERSFTNKTLIEEESIDLLAESNIEEIAIGDYVVHERHGVAIFQGLRRIRTQSIEGEFYLLEYSNNEELYIPVLQSHLVHKYVGGDGVLPHLNSLSRNTWERDKKKAKKSVKSIALDLFRIYQERLQKNGHAFAQNEEIMGAMIKKFPYQETPDQNNTWEHISEDMEQHFPMDRLVCGDVGFGKTEVALRAVFKAIADGKQAAVLVPTTVLARQHYLNFKKRLEPFSVRVAVLSRFNTPAQNRQIVAKVKSGTIDVVIGTHRLIQKDVDFHDLGLLVIDEEQRFGVEHKERIKKKYPLVDVLLLSATPIPRTLYFSLAGARSLDIINTPPKGRHPIQTIIAEYDETLIVNAIKKEIKRDGQIFFLHNDIQTLPTLKQQLIRLLPELRVGIAHGRMSKIAMEKILVDFQERKVDLLLCTTIIENGVDIPSVNTIFINNADKFGLSQLHQIRGRVGRSGLQAHAYMLYQKNKQLTEDGRRRLHALKEFAALGAGYQIALKDLEIRGSGSLLGREQSGHIITIGFTLFLKMLETEFSGLKGNSLPERKVAFPINEENFIPDDYLLEDDIRISFYQKLFGASDRDAIIDVEAEMRDRFGNLPQATMNLINNLKSGMIATGR